MFNLQEKFIRLGSNFANYSKWRLKYVWQWTKLTPLYSISVKKFRLDFEMNISYNESQVFVPILVDLVYF